MNASRELRDITLIYPNLSTNRVIFRTHCLELCAHRFSQDPYVFWKTFCYVCMVWRPQSLPDHLLGDVVSPGAFPEESWTFLNFLNWSSRKWSWSRTHGSQKGDFEAEIVGGNRWTSPENSSTGILWETHFTASNAAPSVVPNRNGSWIGTISM